MLFAVSSVLFLAGAAMAQDQTLAASPSLSPLTLTVPNPTPTVTSVLTPSQAPVTVECWQSTMLDGSPASLPVEPSAAASVGAVCLQVYSTAANGGNNVLFQTVSFPGPSASVSPTAQATASSALSSTGVGMKVILPAVLGSILGLALITTTVLCCIMQRRKQRQASEASKAKKWAVKNFKLGLDARSEPDVEKGVVGTPVVAAPPPRSDSLPVS